MRLQLIAAAALAAMISLGFLVSTAGARTNVDINVGIGGPVFRGPAEPRVVILPGTDAYYVPDYADADVYRDGPWWYCFHEGVWLRAPGYRGPWRRVGYRVVPRVIYGAPVGFRHWERGHPGNGHAWGRERREERRDMREERRGERRDMRQDRREDRRDRRDDRGDGEHGKGRDR
jgi:hypothetical protein